MNFTMYRYPPSVQSIFFLHLDFRYLLSYSPMPDGKEGGESQTPGVSGCPGLSGSGSFTCLLKHGPLALKIDDLNAVASKWAYGVSIDPS